VTTTTLEPADDRVAAAVVEYLEARDCGRPLDPVDWLARHPDVASDLREFLDDSDGLASNLRAFRGEAREPNLTTDERFMGNYELLERVDGNMGIVYRARQLNLPREVAVKVLLRTGAAARARFLVEAKALAKLRHSNVVRIWEVVQGEEVPFFSMEWCPSGTLAARVEHYRQRPLDAAELVERVADAVHSAHLLNILHCDLKPANILFDEFGQPRVADFGLAVPVARTDEENRAPTGTPAYMAPEQLTGEVTVATDVYGLGSILYELLTGRPPHAAPTRTETLEHVRTADPVPPTEIDPKINCDLDAICQMSLAKDPTDRYGSAAELAEDLRRYREGRPTNARPLSLLARVAHSLRQVRTAGADFQALAPGLIGMAAFVFASNSLAFVLLQTGVAELWVWLSVFASYVPLAFVLVREWRSSAHRYQPARRHLWSIWAGHAAACAAVFLAFRVSAADLAQGIGRGYIGCAGLNALAFVTMGSLFAGRQFLLGATWATAALAMGFLPTWEPLIYAVVMAACNLLTGLQLRGISTECRRAESPGTETYAPASR
jgi:hypothetical protein